MGWETIKYFKPEEFDSPDLKGSGDHMNLNFVLTLDKLREAVGFPLLIVSGYRTKEHNDQVGGVDSSAHGLGLAADISARNSRVRFKIIREALRLGIHRIGIGFSFVHVDMDTSKPPSVAWMYPPVIKRT